MQLDWNRVEPVRGRFAWKPFDAAVDAARARGLDVVLVLGPCADWAVDPAWKVPAADRYCSVPKPQFWRSYVKAAVSHFRGRVSYWQVREQPNARRFRGAPSEYAALVAQVAQVARAVDPKAAIIVPEAGNLDLGGLDRLLQSNAIRSCDVLGVHVLADPTRTMLPWSVLTREVLTSSPSGHQRPIWVLGGSETTTTEQWRTHYLLAWVFGATRCYLPAEAIDSTWTSALKDLDYRGFAMPQPGVWGLVFDGPKGAVTQAWSRADRPFEVAVTLSPSARPTEAAATQVEAPAADSPTTVMLGPSPTLLPGAPFGHAIRPGAPTREEVLESRGDLSLALLPMVYLDLSFPERTEFGLSNRALRGLRGGRVVEAPQQGRNCLHTQITYLPGQEEQDNPWIYFDVDDSWLYFDRGRTRVTVTVECEGSWMGEQKLGFNLLYDSTTGYRFTPWQWVDPGWGWHRYGVTLEDVNFANRDGWDFRINAKGSKHDLWVCAVSVEKTPADPLAEVTPPP